jgi:rubredoxin
MDGTHECIPSRPLGQLFFPIFLGAGPGPGSSRDSRVKRHLIKWIDGKIGDFSTFHRPPWWKTHLAAITGTLMIREEDRSYLRFDWTLVVPNLESDGVPSGSTRSGSPFSSIPHPCRCPAAGFTEFFEAVKKMSNRNTAKARMAMNGTATSTASRVDFK